MGEKIAATIVTGFLGAGKSSLIQHLVANAGGRRLALVINEFGELGIDRELLLGCGIEGCGDDDVVELANGCICCTVADDFLPTMRALLERRQPPDHIVIETSGLALPKPLVQAFQWPEVRNRVTVDGVVSVVDAAAVADGRFAADPASVNAHRAGDPALDHDSPLEELFEDQLHCADMVVLNKIDLLDEAGVAAVRAQLRGHLRDGVRVVQTQHGRVPAQVLLGLEARAEDDVDGRKSHHDRDADHNHDEFESFRVALGPVSQPDLLEDILSAVVAQHDVLRIKGFLDVPGKPMRHVVQGVGQRFQRYFDRPWADGERRSELVIIGQHGLDQGAITAAIVAGQNKQKIA